MAAYEALLRAAQIAQTDKYVIFLFEQNTWFHTAKFATEMLTAKAPRDLLTTIIRP